MNVIQIQTNISFGLNYNTHRKIAQRVIEKEYPQLRKYAPVIKSAVQKPDFDEKGFNFNTHFYYPDENIFRPRQSFFDFDGVHNARVKFN